jgi:hypothetical protein
MQPLGAFVLVVPSFHVQNFMNLAAMICMALWQNSHHWLNGWVIFSTQDDECGSLLKLFTVCSFLSFHVGSSGVRALTLGVTEERSVHY